MNESDISYLFKDLDKLKDIEIDESNKIFSLPKYEKFLENFIKDQQVGIARERIPFESETKYKRTVDVLPNLKGEFKDVINRQVEDDRLAEEGDIIFDRYKVSTDNFLIPLLEELEKKVDPALVQNLKISNLDEEALKDAAKRRVYNALRVLGIQEKPEVEFYEREKQNNILRNLLGYAVKQEPLIAISDTVYKSRRPDTPFHEAAHLKYASEENLQDPEKMTYKKGKSLAELLGMSQGDHFLNKQEVLKDLGIEDRNLDYKYNKNPGIAYDIYKELIKTLREK